MEMFLKYFKTGIFVDELGCRRIGILQSGYEPLLHIPVKVARNSKYLFFI
jgi:hypothetical protein